MLAFNQMISNQEARNQRLENEIAELEKSITEIDDLERQKERLLARMEIIEQLQKQPPEIVHLFDEIARQMPGGCLPQRYAAAGQPGRNPRRRPVQHTCFRADAPGRRSPTG